MYLKTLSTSEMQSLRHPAILSSYQCLQQLEESIPAASQFVAQWPTLAICQQTLQAVTVISSQIIYGLLPLITLRVSVIGSILVPSWDLRENKAQPDLPVPQATLDKPAPLDKPAQLDQPDPLVKLVPPDQLAPRVPQVMAIRAQRDQRAKPAPLDQQAALDQLDEPVPLVRLDPRVLLA